MSTSLSGWKAIADFLGQTVSTAQHWAKEGMPVRRLGRYMTASTSELSAWLGRQQAYDWVRGPVHIAARSERDASEELRRGLQDARRWRGLYRVK